MTTAYNKFLINGKWVEADRATLDVINPATEEAFASISMGTCLLYTSPSPRDVEESRMPSSA